MGVNIIDKFLDALLFADDQVVIALDEHNIKYMMRKLTETCEK